MVIVYVFFFSVFCIIRWFLIICTILWIEITQSQRYKPYKPTLLRYGQGQISWIILLSYVVRGWIKINTEIRDQSALFISISMIRFWAEFNFIQTYTRLVYDKNEFNNITGKFFSERCLFKLRQRRVMP